MVWIILLIVVALIVVALIALYNRLVRYRNRVGNGWGQIEGQLKRRWDLIPNLVATVRGYAQHERGTFEAVTQARAAAQNAQGPAATAAAEGILGQALGRLGQLLGGEVRRPGGADLAGADRAAARLDAIDAAVGDEEAGRRAILDDVDAAGIGSARIAPGHRVVARDAAAALQCGAMDRVARVG